MSVALAAESPAAPRVAALLPVAMLLHQAEEWFGGFTAWTAFVLGDGISNERFLVINATGLVLFTIGTVAALRSPQMAWFAASFAALLALNGVVHTLATLGFGRYSPGTVTGLLVFIPLGAIVLRASAARLTGGAFTAAVVFGVALHAMVTLIAIR